MSYESTPPQPDFNGAGDTDAFFEAQTPEGRRVFLMNAATFFRELRQTIVATVGGATMQGVIQTPPASFASAPPLNPIVRTYRLDELATDGRMDIVMKAAIYTAMLFAYHGIESQIPRASLTAIADAYWLPTINLETVRLAAWIVAGTTDTDLTTVGVLPNAILPWPDEAPGGQPGEVTIVAPGQPATGPGALTATPTAPTAGTGLVAVEHTAAQSRGGLVFGLALAATLGTVALATSQKAPRRRRRAA